MSGTPARFTRFVLPVLGLLLVPAALFAGWLAGRAPVPAAPAPAYAAPRRDVAIASSGQPLSRPELRLGGAGSSVPAGFATPPAAKTPGEPTGEFSQWTTLASATEESRRNGKPILIDFSAEWCGPCQRLKAEVFDDAVRGQAVQTAVIPVSIVDRVREAGANPQETRDLQQRYDVEAFPTLVVFSPATGRVVTTRGFGDAERTLQWITGAAKSVR